MLRQAEGRFVAVISGVHGLVHTIELTYAALLIRIGLEFSADKLALGAVATAAAFTLGFGALPAGVLVDRLGPRRTLNLAFGLSMAAALLVAFSPNLATLAVTLAILGLASGLYHPAGLSAIATVARHPPSAIAWHGVGGNLGIAAAPIIATLVAQAAGWRWAYALLAFLCLVAAVLLRTLLPSQEAMAVRGTVTPQNDPARRAQWVPLAIVYALSIVGGFVYRGSLTFLPAHIEEQVTFGGPAVASMLTTAALLTGALGQVTGGTLARRFRLEPLAACLMLPLAPSLLAMGLSSELTLVAVSGLFVFFNFSTQPLFTALVAAYSPAAAVGRSYGAMFFASFGVGSLAGAFAGVIADRWDTGAVYVALSALALTTFLLSVALALYVARGRSGEREAAAVAG